MGKAVAVLVGVVLAVSALEARGGIVVLQPASGDLDAQYQHTFHYTNASGDPNAIRLNTVEVSDPLPNQAFYYRVASGSVGSVVYNFELTPPPDRPNAVVQDIAVTSHSHDWGPGHAFGEFWTDQMTAPMAFFDTAADGNGIVTRSLGDYDSVAGARSVQIVYTADLGGGSVSTQQLLGAHIGATQQWTFDVSATWADAPPAGFTVIPVKNHSFESEYLPGDDQWAPANRPLDGSSWSYPAGNYQVLDPAAYRFAGCGGDNANTQNVLPDGGQIYNLGTSPLAQAFGPAEPTTEYLLSFWIGTAVDLPAQSAFRAELLDGGVAFAVLEANAPLAGTFKQFTLLGETGPTIAGDLEIRFTKTASGTVWLDDVEPSSRFIPEPCTLALLGLGLAAFARRRR